MGEEFGSLTLLYKNLEFITELALGEKEGRLTVDLNTVFLRFD